MEYIEFAVRVVDSHDYKNNKEVYTQRIPMDFANQVNPDVLRKVIAVVNNLPVPMLEEVL